MIKCRQGGAARLKFIMLVGCAVGGVRCQRGVLRKKKKERERERERGKKREEKVRGCNVSSLSLSHQQSSIVCVSYRSLHPTEWACSVSPHRRDQCTAMTAELVDLLTVTAKDTAPPPQKKTQQNCKPTGPHREHCSLEQLHEWNSRQFSQNIVLWVISVLFLCFILHRKFTRGPRFVPLNQVEVNLSDPFE